MELRALKYLLAGAAMTLMASLSVAQPSSSDTAQSSEIIKPRIEIGIGRLGYYGDIGQNFQTYNPLVGNVGAHFKIGAPLYHFLDFNAYAIYGRLSMSETTGIRRLNFSSQLKVMGAGLSYNFGNFLKPNHNVAPYISIGVAGFEFLSKTDLFDANGNRYHYWDDGSIRNLPENSPDAHNAVEIQRDYDYETDIRKRNADGFGEYAERSWAIPVGAGATLNLTDHLQLRLGAEMFFSFTNYIDGVTDESTGSRSGNDQNDWFLYTNAGISYNFEPHGKKRKHKPDFSGPEMLALSEDDQDADGVNDFSDKCPNTPTDAKVDENGCPVDSDKDGVPDYKDAEPGTAEDAFVTAEGETITDEYFLNSYLFWIDSVYDYQYLTSRIETESVPQSRKSKRPDYRSYHVMAEGDEEMSAEMIEKILSIPDIKAIEQDGETMYLIGDYDELYQAVERKLNLEADGVSGIVVADDSGRIVDLTEEAAPILDDLKRIADVDEAFDDEMAQRTMDVVYRVQIGAFSNPLSKDIFSDVRDLIVITGDDGLTRYVSGSFTNLQDAAGHKVDLLLEGFEGAFITAYRGGKRISLTDAGAIVSGTDESSTREVSSPSFNVSKVKFRVQVAAYRDEVPTEMLDKFIELGEIKPMRGPDGATRYVFGEFKTYEAAADAKQLISEQQFEDAFVVGEFNGQIISAQEALQLLEEN